MTERTSGPPSSGPSTIRSGLKSRSMVRMSTVIGLARNEAKLIKHFGKKCPHMRLVFENAGAWRNWPAAERNDFSHSQCAALIDHGCVPPQNWPCGKLRRMKHLLQRSRLQFATYNPQTPPTAVNGKSARHFKFDSDGKFSATTRVGLHRLDDALGHFLCVAKKHHGVVAIEQRIVDFSIARTRASA